MKLDKFKLFHDFLKPPGGTQTGKNDKSKISNPKKGVNTSLPNIPRQTEQPNSQNVNQQQTSLANLIKQKKEEQDRIKREELEEFEREIQNSELNKNIDDYEDDEEEDEDYEEETKNR